MECPWAADIDLTRKGMRSVRVGISLAAASALQPLCKCGLISAAAMGPTLRGQLAYSWIHVREVPHRYISKRYPNRIGTHARRLHLL